LGFVVVETLLVFGNDYSAFLHNRNIAGWTLLLFSLTVLAFTLCKAVVTGMVYFHPRYTTKEYVYDRKNTVRYWLVVLFYMVSFLVLLAVTVAAYVSPMDLRSFINHSNSTPILTIPLHRQS
jgi:uncharacterized BrkB/YihY/UPF0761 family membrane protein